MAFVPSEASKKKSPSKQLKPSRLGNVRKGRQKGARRFCFYGPESVGKTTLAAHAPNPILIDIEDGSSELDVARYVFPGGDVMPRNYQEILDALADIRDNEHDYKTLVIDSLDRLEGMIWDHCVARDSGKQTGANPKSRKIHSIEGYGFGKGYNVALDELRGLLKGLDGILKKREMNIVFVGHTHVKMFKNPSGEDYDRYWLRVHPSFAGQTKEWVDVLGFCCFEEGGGKAPGQDRSKGWSSGRRLLKLERDAAYDAKSRIAVPKEIELLPDDPWAPLQAAIEAGQNLGEEELIVLINQELERIGDDELTAKVQEAYAGVTDVARLNRFRVELQTRMPKEEAEDNE